MNPVQSNADVPLKSDLPYPVAEAPRPLTPTMERELRGCFDFFWKESVEDPALPTFGLHSGDYVGMIDDDPIPIESHGFYFPVIILGVERGWISRAEAEKRTLHALKSLEGLEHFNGFHHHFIDPVTAREGWGKPTVEVSNMATATMIAGALIAAEYFGGEVKQIAETLYERIDWNSFLDPEANHFYLARHPGEVPEGKQVNEDGYFGHWASYDEHILMYVLAAGAPREEFAISADPYYHMNCPVGSYKGEPFIYCHTGSAFTYQWTHSFIDFRNIIDRNGRNWFENSRHAAIAARQFAIDMADEIKGLGPNSWGMTASLSPTTFYSGHYGSLPAGSGADLDALLMDGTVAPYGSSAFVVFTPEASIEALESMYTIPGLAGEYGLYDAYSFHTRADGDQPWIAKTYLAIDKGLVALMFENYSTQLVWKLFHQNRHVRSGLKRLGFIGPKSAP